MKLGLWISVTLFSGLCFGHGIPLVEWENSRTDAMESEFISNTRQLTFAGLRSGEGYFSKDAQKMIFQSERDPKNPYYQIFLTDRTTGETKLVSPGTGMTTCAWIHPTKERVLFASTHEDPKAEEKMAAELDRRARGEARGYGWDFDENYEIYESDFDGTVQKKLTDALGYDAEGDWSPDGSKIVFASNRSGYDGSMSPEDEAIFAKDKSYMMDIFIMNADGTGVKRLTTEKGYDGGPFFSSDGQKITWRHFSEDGRSAEIYTMNIDGSEKRQLTRLGKMSWAPYFHPSGDYLIFTTNLLGHHNFELYAVDARGDKDPVRVTYTNGFDGLPVFLPNGKEISWTTTRGEGKGGQIFIGDWNDAEIRRQLELPAANLESSDEITENDLRHHIEMLASPMLLGRRTGSEGAKRAATYAADLFASWGLQAEGSKGFHQKFTFTSGVSLGSKNSLRKNRSGQESLSVELNQAWRPVAFSKNGSYEIKDVVFAGYGLEVSASENFPAYNSYENLDVKDKWVAVFRFVPEQVKKEFRRHLTRNASLRRKAMIARDLGAKGIIFISGPNSSVNDQLIRLAFDASSQGAGIPALSFTDAQAEALFPGLENYQTDLDMGKILSLNANTNLSVDIEIKQDQAVGQNTLARLQVGPEPSTKTIIIGAHIDHLGSQINPDTNAIEVFNGADDNASGSAALIEIAQLLSSRHKAGQIKLKHDIVFALWSGEELGLLGSDHFMKDFEGRFGRPFSKIAAYVNMDMIGRFRNKLVLQGTGSSSWWKPNIERLNTQFRLPISLQDDPYLPTDSTSFYLRGVPTLNFFTGAHDDYHKISDTPEKINYDDLRSIALFSAEMVQTLATKTETPDYVKVPQANIRSTGFRVFLGTIPDYANTSVDGVLLNGVKAGSPSDKAGLKSGDIIIRLDGTKIGNIYDYTYVLSALRVGEAVKIEVMRDQKKIELEITPASRS